VVDAKKIRLHAWFKTPGDHCHYIYDFGDDWVHRVELRQIVTSDERSQRRLIDGRLAGPPEDCG
jgi:uncharacterized protein